MNAIAAENEADNVTELRTPGPGERLRNARMAEGLELSKVAGQLHLTGDMVDALECDDYSEMPARVFVRGYIRNYARLVELPESSVLAQFDELWPEESDALKVDHAPRLASDTKPGGGAWGSFFTWLLVVGGAALFLLWWLGHLDGLMANVERVIKPKAEPAIVSPQLPMPDATQGGELVLPAPDSSPQPAPAASAVPQSEPAAALVVPEPAPTAAVAVTASAAPAVVEVPGSVPAATSDVVPAVTAALTEPVAAEPKASVVTAPPKKPIVKITFNEDCWVDIRSADRKFRLFGTMRKGTVRNLGGESPYRMTLGNVSAVDLRVNGKAFDLAPHTRENIARLTLSP